MSKMWFILDCYEGHIGEIFLGMPDPENNAEKALQRAVWEWNRMTTEEQDRRFAFVLGLGEVETDHLTIDYKSAGFWIDIAQIERDFDRRAKPGDKRIGTWIVTMKLKLNEGEKPDNGETLHE